MTLKLPRDHDCRLLVEGKIDQHAIQGLLSRYVDWGITQDDWPMYIEPVGDAPTLLNDVTIPNTIRGSVVRRIGVVVDADGDCSAKWSRIQQICRPLVSSLPDELNRSGMIAEFSGKRFGVWIMPDNHSSGNIESWLATLIKQDDPTWEYSGEVVHVAKGKGALFAEKDATKARLRTWLAWQQEPGAPFGTAFRNGCFDARSAPAVRFVNWCVSLFGLQLLRESGGIITALEAHPAASGQGG